jgi:hypothetical protein
MKPKPSLHEDETLREETPWEKKRKEKERK